MGEVGGQHGKEEDNDGYEVDSSCDQDHEVVGEAKVLMKSEDVVWRGQSLVRKGGEVKAVEAEDIAPVGDGLLEKGDLCVLKQREISELNQGG